MLNCMVIYVEFLYSKCIMSMVLKTELDRLVQPVQSGNGYQFGSVKMPKIVSITCQNREPKANPVLPLVQFLKS